MTYETEVTFQRFLAWLDDDAYGYTRSERVALLTQLAVQGTLKLRVTPELVCSVAASYGGLEALAELMASDKRTHIVQDYARVNEAAFETFKTKLQAADAAFKAAAGPFSDALQAARLAANEEYRAGELTAASVVFFKHVAGTSSASPSEESRDG